MLGSVGVAHDRPDDTLVVAHDVAALNHLLDRLLGALELLGSGLRLLELALEHLDELAGLLQCLLLVLLRAALELDLVGGAAALAARPQAVVRAAAGL